MLITVLAENSHIRAVGFEGEEIRFHASVQTEPRQTSDYYILMLTQLFTLYGVSGERITGVVLASVVPQLTPTLIDALARIAGSRHKLLSLSSGIKTGLNIRSDQPQQVGADRVAAAVAAKARVCRAWSWTADARQPLPCSMKTARSSRRPSPRASSFRSKRFVHRPRSCRLWRSCAAQNMTLWRGTPRTRCVSAQSWARLPWSTVSSAVMPPFSAKRLGSGSRATAAS